VLSVVTAFLFVSLFLAPVCKTVADLDYFYFLIIIMKKLLLLLYYYYLPELVDNQRSVKEFLRQALIYLLHEQVLIS